MQNEARALPSRDFRNFAATAVTIITSNNRDAIFVSAAVQGNSDRTCMAVISVGKMYAYIIYFRHHMHTTCNVFFAHGTTKENIHNISMIAVLDSKARLHHFSNTYYKTGGGGVFEGGWYY